MNLAVSKLKKAAQYLTLQVSSYLTKCIHAVSVMAAKNPLYYRVTITTLSNPLNFTPQSISE